MRALLRNRRAATALEFAIVGPPALLMLVFITEITYDFYAQEALDYGVAAAARSVQIGAVQGSTNSTTFKVGYLCPAVGGLLSCNNITVNVQTIAPNYYAAGSYSVPAGGQFGNATVCLGAPGTLVLVQAAYLSPSLVAAFVPGMAISVAGLWQHATVSSAAFMNESFTPATGVTSC